jgi:DsbC/DsbD-like thiol-disulfide interchange protein
MSSPEANLTYRMPRVVLAASSCVLYFVFCIFAPRRVLAASSCVLYFVLCVFAFPSSLRADPLKIDLVSETTSIQPGVPFSVGLHLKHREHYHTYWKFPGIVGVPTDVEWELPSGWQAKPLEWPAPERVMMFQIKAQGYHGEALIPTQLVPPGNLQPGAKVTLKGKATWMCCGRDCTPGFTDLSLTLPVEQGPPAVDERWQKLFAQARAGMPRPLTGFSASATRSGDRVTLKLTPTKGQAGAAPTAGQAKRDNPDGIFFTEDGYINANMEQVFRQEDDGLSIDLKTSKYFTDKPPAELLGVLWLKDGSLGKGAIIRAPFAK